jgi:CO dehydrogenase/acetyl-CoA synthase delta subunit
MARGTEDRATTVPRRLAIPRRVAVTADDVDDGRPVQVDGREVDGVRESWLIEDRWWTDRPLRRRYWEVVTTCGRNEVVFQDLRSGRWWRQR